MNREDASPRRVLRSAALWSLTASGVVILLIALGSRVGWLASLSVALVVATLVVAALLPVAIAAAYLLVRRAAARSGTAHPDRASRLRGMQAGLAGLVDRFGDPTPDGRVRRAVLGDRLRITADTLADLGDRESALAFIWTTRPSQPADFPRSADFVGLPAWAQDAVVLLDLRRELALRGTSAFDDEPGFYRHPFARTREAVARLGSADLDAAVTRGRRMRDRDAAAQALQLLERPETWSPLLAHDG